MLGLSEFQLPFSTNGHTRLLPMVGTGVRQVMNMIRGPQGIQWRRRRALCEFAFLAVWGECIMGVCSPEMLFLPGVAVTGL